MRLIKEMFLIVVKGSPLYYLWLMFLFALIALAGYLEFNQLSQGLLVTNLSNNYPAGFYIANFVFMIGIAAGAVTLVYPTYIYKMKSAGEVVIFGELLAICALIIAVCFILVDMGHPERLLHIMPFIGTINLPSSLLAWDVVVVTGYLLINLFCVLYFIIHRYRQTHPNKKLYLPIKYIAIVWAISIHTCTAFLFSGLIARPFWNHPLVAPKFLATAVTSGPALLILLLIVLEKRLKVPVKEEIYKMLSATVFYGLVAVTIMILSEFFVEMYSGAQHNMHAVYQWFGVHGFHQIALFSWVASMTLLVSMVLMMFPRVRQNRKLLVPICIAVVAAVLIDKGVLFIFPAYIPNPLGEWQEYAPNAHEIGLVLGVYALGALIYTWGSRLISAVYQGTLTKS